MSKFHNRYSDEELIQILKDAYIELGRVPYIRDFNKRKPNASTFRRFGSWQDALKKAGLTKEKQKSTDYTKEELINLLKKYYIEYNKVPTTRDLKSTKGYPSDSPFRSVFGSFKQALIDAELFDLRKDKDKKIFDRKPYTKEELLTLLDNYIKKKGRIPSWKEIDSLKELPSCTAYIAHFGSMENVINLLGYDLEKQRQQDLQELKSDMLKKYKILKERLGRVPSSRDIEEYCRKEKSIYSMGAYEFHFGSLYELQLLCGFTPTVIGRNKTNEDLLDDLVRISYEIGRTPSQNDLIFFDDVANYHKYAKEFGSWNNAVKLAGLKPNNDVYYSNNGIECLSYYELLFTNMLEKYNIKFLKEEFYKDYIPTKRRFRFDYVVDLKDKKIFVEIFGITCKENYKERTKEKITLCVENKIDLIEIYPEDFTSYKLEKIHKMFLSKLQK